MKSFYKLKSIFLLMSSVCFIGCDGESQIEDGSSLTERTPSDTTISAGELFTFENLLDTEADQFLDTLRVTADNVFTVGDVDFVYAKTGIFTATLTADVPSEDALNDAADQIFSNNNASNTEVRSLLAVENASDELPTFTDDELDRLVELLNVNGAGVSLSPENPDTIVVTPNTEYTFTFTSTQGERANGLAAGQYALEAVSQVVTFQITSFNDDEGNIFLFYVPVVSSEFLDVELFEQGTFTLQLNNSLQ